MKCVWLLSALVASSCAVTLPKPTQSVCPPFEVDSIKEFLATNPEPALEARGDVEKRACICAGSAGTNGWRWCPCGPRQV
ncbi:hypothetical protein NW762_011956 [Fusarium torreyae]|uniref:Uncharacterized protein n=1 Tax=Fusarium torreyae TaxID=1237075 RepID=A0A9W8RRB9_9HYPO|nr:hypothetical protein NW762_011956 [Fusarium torreyae]